MNFATPVATAFTAHGADYRYIINNDNNKKGMVKAQANKLAGELLSMLVSSLPHHLKR